MYKNVERLYEKHANGGLTVPETVCYVLQCFVLIVYKYSRQAMKTSVAYIQSKELLSVVGWFFKGLTIVAIGWFVASWWNVSQCNGINPLPLAMWNLFRFI